MRAATIYASIHLEIVSDEALFKSGRTRVLDGEVPTTKDLIAHIHTATLPEHPGVLVADYRSIREVYRWAGWIQGKWLVKLLVLLPVYPNWPANHHDETEEEDGEDSSQVQQRCIQARQIQGTTSIETKEDRRAIQVALQKGGGEVRLHSSTGRKHTVHTRANKPLPIPGRNPKQSHCLQTSEVL